MSEPFYIDIVKWLYGVDVQSEIFHASFKDCPVTFMEKFVKAVVQSSMIGADSNLYCNNVIWYRCAMQKK